MPIRLHDTRRREKVNFTTLEPGKVSMYVCGVTVYDRCHLGHARCYLAFDLIHRWLEASGYDVHYVQNFTDIDDKIIHRANELGGDWKALVDQNIETYYEDMDALNILRADDYPRCTEYVDDMIRITQDLIDKNHAYVADDGVYFDVESAPEKYGQLTGQSIDAVRSGAGGRVGDTGSGKRDHKDFALWKAAKPDEPTWDSPWGPGRPGWHIECTAMSMDYFGKEFDIHGGGHDLRFPHHEAEICQGECHTGHSPVVHHWLHNGFVNIDGEKMSKSLGNFWTIRDILTKVDAMVLRFALINAHYRSPIDMNEALLNDAERNYNRLLECYVASLKAREHPSPIALPNPTSPPPFRWHGRWACLRKWAKVSPRRWMTTSIQEKRWPKCWAWCEKSARCLERKWRPLTETPSLTTLWICSRKRPGACWVSCLHRMWRWPNLKKTRGKQKSPMRLKRCCFSVARQERTRIGRSLIKSETNSTSWAWWLPILRRVQSGTLRDHSLSSAGGAIGGGAGTKALVTVAAASCSSHIFSI